LAKIEHYKRVKKIDGGDTETKVCVDLNSKWHHKIKGSGFGIPTLALAGKNNLLPRGGSSNVCIPFRLNQVHHCQYCCLLIVMF
jgi:hypothetical protein